MSPCGFTFDLLTFVSDHTWRVTWLTPLPGLDILRLSVLELWVLTSPIGYHWQCVCSHCAVLGDHDFPLAASNFVNLTAFTAIGSHIFTAHAQKWLSVNLTVTIMWHRHSIPWPDLLTENDISEIWRRFLLIFVVDKLNYPHSYTFVLVGSLTQKVITCCIPNVESFHQVWIWYDHPLRSYIALLLLIHYVTLGPWPLTLVSGLT